MDLKDVLKKNHAILCHYGAMNQIAKWVEETGELNLELTKNNLGMGNLKNIQSEIADVLNMTIQLAHLFGFDDIKSQMEYKIHRTLELIHNDIKRKKTNLYFP